MRELFYTLWVAALFRHLSVPFWIFIPVILSVLLIDFTLRKMAIKDQAELEALKMFMNKKQG